MHTLSKLAKDTGIVLAVSAALVLGFGARASADPAPNPSPTPLLQFNGGGPAPSVLCGITVYDAPHVCAPSPVQPTSASVRFHHQVAPKPSTFEAVVWNGSQQIAQWGFFHGRIR